MSNPVAESYDSTTLAQGLKHALKSAFTPDKAKGIVGKLRLLRHTENHVAVLKKKTNQKIKPTNILFIWGA